MNWLTLTIISYLLLAFVNLGDKFVMDKILGDSRVYAFTVTILSLIVVIIAPWFKVAGIISFNKYFSGHIFHFCFMDYV